MSPEEINLVTESIKAIGSKESNEWIPVIAALGGAVFGSLFSIITSSIIEHKKRESVFIANYKISHCRDIRIT